MRALRLLAAALLQGCVFLPRTETVIDPACSGRECSAVLAVLGAITAGSLVVSGSIVVVGNVVYWVEKQGKCAVI
jgi:hypothetical protein